MDSHEYLTSQERAYAFLRDRILDVHYRPSQRLKALEIAKELGLSRTPVKEALSRLEQEGLVQRAGGYGYVVQAVRVRDVLNLYKVRELLEVEAAKAALPNVSSAMVKQLAQILARAKAHLLAKKLDLFLRTNREFYSALFAAGDNEVLEQTLASLNSRIWSVGSMVVKEYPPRADQIVLENQRVLKALRAKDPEALEHAIRAHIRAAGEAVKAFLQREDRNLFFAA